MRVIRAIASVRDQISVVLQHVEMVVGNDALDFSLSPLLGLGHSQVDGLSLEGFWVPLLWKISHHPIANFWIAGVQGSGLGGEGRLGPIDSKTELEPTLVRIVSHGRETVRKLLRIRVPVAYVAKPTGINMKHLHVYIGGVANHAQSNFLIHSHSATPAVVDCQGIVGIVPCFGIAENGMHPAA